MELYKPTQACCGMLQNPHQRPLKSTAAACRGMLRPLGLGGVHKGPYVANGSDGSLVISALC